MAINRMYKPLLDGMGVTYPQYLVLTVLESKTDEPFRNRRTAGLRAQHYHSPSKELERAGFLSRSRNTKDEREVQVSLTAKGKKLFNQSGCLTDKLIRNSGMTAEDLVSLNERVQSLRDPIKRNNNGASPA